MPLILLVDDCDVDHLAFARALFKVAPNLQLRRWKRVGDALLGLACGDLGEAGLLFIDVQLPGLDGHHLLRKLRCHPATQTLPIIMMSGSTPQYQVRRSFQLGAQGHLAKSGQPGLLERNLRCCLDYWLYTTQLPVSS